MRKKKVIGISFFMALSLMLTGCSVFPTLAGMESKEAKAYANVYDLKANKAYVWHHEGEADIRQDLARDREGENWGFLSFYDSSFVHIFEEKQKYYGSNRRHQSENQSTPRRNRSEQHHPRQSRAYS